MLKSIAAKNVGPIPEFSVKFGPCLNIMTGDNGLGKTFLLDMIWYAMTSFWPAEVNPRMVSGLMGRPLNPKKDAIIDFTLTGNGSSSKKYQSKFDRNEQLWVAQHNLNPQKNELVVYALADGSLCVWDPARSYWSASLERSGKYAKYQSAFVFTPNDIWNGLKQDGNNVCNGLIVDLLKWQDKDSFEYDCMKFLLEELSPADFTMRLDEPTRISIDDVRDIPTIRMPYGVVPVLHASSAIRRILSLAYCLTWAYSEHKKACDIRGIRSTSQMTFLMDEVDAHLHPNWQRKIMKALLDSIGEILGLRTKGKVQIIASTHSPLVMASLEDVFDESKDKWLDFDYENDGTISFTEREFEKLGTSESWLKSKAFDLKDSRSIESSEKIRQIYDLLKEKRSDKNRIRLLFNELVEKLSPLDRELFLIRYMCQKKGILP